MTEFAQWERDGLQRWLDEIADAVAPGAGAPATACRTVRSWRGRGYRDAVMPRWHRERLVLAGDAAHAMSPQLGQGVNMALMDAAGAARCIARACRPRRSAAGLCGAAARARGASISSGVAG